MVLDEAAEENDQESNLQGQDHNQVQCFQARIVNARQPIAPMSRSVGTHGIKEFPSCGGEGIILSLCLQHYLRSWYRLLFVTIDIQCFWCYIKKREGPTYNSASKSPMVTYTLLYKSWVQTKIIIDIILSTFKKLNSIIYFLYLPMGTIYLLQHLFVFSKA